jgi:D-beta-D-heptose 7-phosphate kinase/D-beta-D-heptose 1-phosphate adenosyltransferase
LLKKNEHLKKHITNIALSGLVELLRSNKQKIVFTNGCFDILHPGHIDYLQKSKNLGDVLILGLNSDNSIKSLKGLDRPINVISDRLKMLDALEAVDFIIEFDEETPINLITKIKPDVLVKGGDYTVETIVGSEFVIDNGGKVEVIPFLEGYSTTQLIEKIKAL